MNNGNMDYFEANHRPEHDVMHETAARLRREGQEEYDRNHPKLEDPDKEHERYLNELEIESREAAEQYARDMGFDG